MAPKFLPSAILLRGLEGDFDGNGLLTSSDIDLLSAAVRDGGPPTPFDVNRDGQVDQLDREEWVVDLKRTYFGDSNLDGEFNSGDLIFVLSQGEYEDGVVGNSTWSSGDWNGDGEFESGDFITALQFTGYELGPRQAVAAVPEPAALGVSALAGLVLLFRRRHTTSRL